jgi:hypothetical protein
MISPRLSLRFCLLEPIDTLTPIAAQLSAYRALADSQNAGNTFLAGTALAQCITWQQSSYVTRRYLLMGDLLQWQKVTLRRLTQLCTAYLNPREIQRALVGKLPHEGLRHGRIGMLRCPSLRIFFSFPPSSGPEGGAGYFPVRGVAGRRCGTVHEGAGKKSLTTGRHASRVRFDVGRGT